MKLHRVFTLILAIVVTTAAPAYTQTYSVLYNFNNSAADGIVPTGTLSEDVAGNLYGTTQVGGKNSVGVVFRLSPSGTETILYSFGLLPDGMFPQRGVIRDRAGNLYGTTYQGGKYGTANNDGTVFKLDRHRKETVVHSFGGGNDGSYPNGELIRDARGNLYGVTGAGGTHGYGNVFKITPKGREIILHTFGGSEGATPSGALIRDREGNLYGTTVTGGVNGYGTAYEITAAGIYKVLYNFCTLSGCADGRQPMGGLVRDSAGNFYGTTIGGGANNQGTVYKLSRAGEESVVHSFASLNEDGYLPWSELILDHDGNLYGTTYGGGAHGAGTVFKLDVSGTETVLHSFCAAPNCADGSAPSWGRLHRDAAGNLYGVAELGANQAGIVYKLTP